MRPAPVRDPLVGRVIDGRYEIQARIGEGGMGVVYRCRQTSVDRVIALKMLNPEMAGDPAWVQRFYNEAKASSRLQHPNTIRMFDFGQTNDGRLFITMEFLDGIGLRQAIAQGPMEPTRVLKILIQCCASLAEAHALGIIHRDIKPDNVFLLNMAGSPDFVKLLDFSVAKLLAEGPQGMRTKAGVVFGTPPYMSPEQGRAMPLDARSDLYALGILGFEMLSGQLPFQDDNPLNVIQMHLRAELPPLPHNVPAGVQQLIRRACEKDPSRRYQSAGELMQHAQHLMADLTAGRSAPMPQQPPSGFAPAHAAQTVIAGPRPGHVTGPPPASPARADGPAPGPSASGAMRAASPMQKTMIAGMPAAAPPPEPMRPGRQETQPPPAAPPPNKTVMIAPTDGVVSVARPGAAASFAPASGPSAMFWLVSMVLGMMSGVVAFLIYRAVM